ncbi:MAG: LytTR family transcriptional regulator DNA-binding domain-containing protein [Calditrichia bacterium]
MFAILNQSYPPPQDGRRSIATAILFGSFIGLFLIFFEPFDLNLSSYKNKTLTLFLYGLISTAVLLIFLHLLPRYFPALFSEQHWTVKHHAIFYSAILFTIATLNGLYANFINDLSFSWPNYWWIINRTFVLGGIPIAFLTTLDYNRKLRQHVKEASDIVGNLEEVERSSDEPVWKITTDLKDETFSVSEQFFMYAEAIGNYIEIHHIESSEVKKATYRLSLSSFEKQLSSDHLIRCHRSYLVNLKMVEDVSGNAQGLKLKLKELARLIPVSRKYIPTIKKRQA